MLHLIEVRITINSHDDNSPMPNAAPPGPMVAHKEVSFGGFGRSLPDAVAEVQANVNAFLESDAVEIGSREKRILSPHRPS